MANLNDEQGSWTDSDEAWDVVFEHADETSGRHLSDHERWVIDHLIHETTPTR
jgi:hypothetical protein